MISLTAARAALEATITDHAPSIKAVYPRAVDAGVVPSPIVVLAATISGEFDQVGTACLASHNDTIDLPVAVCVARDGLDEVATQTALEGAWVEVLTAIRDHLHEGPLAQIGYARRVKSVEPGDYVIGATEYPAQILHIEFQG